MKKLLILLAALSLVACTSNEAKEEHMTETTTMATEVAVEETAVVMEEMSEMEEVVEEIAEEVMEDTMAMEEAMVMEEAPTTYTVMEGDNLYQIGLKYNMTWDKLTEENHISNPDLLEVGQEIIIPAE